MLGASRYISLSGLALVASILWMSPSSADVAIPRSPERWLTDSAGLLSETARARVDTRLQEYQGTSGHQVVVFIARTIGGAPLDDYAVKVFEAWGIGRKGHDDGVLLLVLAQDHAIDIEVGYGLEDRLTDAISHRVIDDVMAPLLRAGNPDAAVSSGVDAILSAIEGHPVPSATGQPSVAEPLNRPSPAELVLFGILGLLLLGFVVTHPRLAMYFLFTIFNGGGGFGGGRGGGGFSGGGGGGGFGGGGGRSGGGGARGGW